MIKVESSFGEPSDELLFGTFNDREVVFLPRHGRGHKIPPSDINYLANIEIYKADDNAKLLGENNVLGYSQAMIAEDRVWMDVWWKEMSQRFRIADPTRSIRFI